LFVVSDSVLVVVMMAVFVIVVELDTVGAVVVIVTVALAPAARVPSMAVGIPPGAEHPPTDAVQETNETPAGRGSVTSTLLASEPPMFCTVIV